MSLPKLQVCFSAGRTSGYMSWLLKQRKQDEYEMIFTIANTGLEHEDSLRFADAVDRNFGLNLVWLEAVVNPEGTACTHKVVSYATASRNGEPFEQMAAKYGIPNHTFKHCTRELKANVMSSYADSVWPDRDYSIAIGIRADEKRRVSPSASKHRIVYPLVDMFPTRKRDVLDFFEQFDWNLKIPEYLGNCRACFKKTDSKLHSVRRSEPDAFDFLVQLESKYAGVGPNVVDGPRKMFRGYRSTEQLLAQIDYLNFANSWRLFDEEESGGCSESCEVFETL